MPPTDPAPPIDPAREIDRLRQLLQAGVALATSVLDGDDVTDDLKKWIAAATAPPPSS